MANIFHPDFSEFVALLNDPNNISLSDLKINKAATGRRQDLLDLDNLDD